MAAITLLEPPTTGGAATSLGPGTREFGRAVIESVLHRRGISFSIDTHSEAEMRAISSRLESFLMVVTAATGGTSARVAPRFMGDTYPAMSALTCLLPSGWSSEGSRTVCYGHSRQVFVSVDRPVPEPGSNRSPDRLLEVASANRIDRDWYRATVSPRVPGAGGLTTVYYGAPGASGPVYSEAVGHHLQLQAGDGVQRHFVADSASVDGGAWTQPGLPAAV